MRLEDIFMPESAAQQNSEQAGKQFVLPPPLPLRAEHETIVVVPVFVDPPELHGEESPKTMSGRVAVALTTLASMSFFRRPCFTCLRGEPR